MTHTYELSHWDNPRATIAAIHEKDDDAYYLHGAHMAADALKIFDLKPSELESLTLLDFGCGTGRISRVFARYFKHVHAYDPNKNCIDGAHKEAPGVPIPNVTFTNDFGKVKKCDFAVAINVIEHLSDDDACKAIDDMLSKAHTIALWIPRNNKYLSKYEHTVYMPGKRISYVKVTGRK